VAKPCNYWYAAYAEGDEAKALIQNAGGKVTEIKTDYVVVGKMPVPSGKG